MDTADWYRRFAEYEARGSSPRYDRLATAVADSAALLEWLSLLPNAKRQPNLLFASVRFLGGPTDSVEGFVEFVQSNSDPLAAMMNARTTQTNEVARCGAFLPLLSAFDGEIALIEIGASAGLCLFPDRYAYDFEGSVLGDSALVIPVDTAGTIAVPQQLPRVSWRVGLDLDPLDVADADDMAWLRACVWPEHVERRRRLDLAAAIVAADPPEIMRGDLRDNTLALIEAAPSGSLKVVFHSAVLPYVDEGSRRNFVATMRNVVNDRDDVVWLSSESVSMIAGLEATEVSDDEAPARAPFHLVRNGAELIALTDPHGRWLRWLAPPVGEDVGHA